ncbi:MAG: hypothetical protein GY904_00735 [Planctomycetaceae bacterium]|jgi:hypothetical protein|nr:hypothetical protein [Planctomycetaceae bacterium]
MAARKTKMIHWTAVVLLAGCLMPGGAVAATFRVTTRLFEGAALEPAAEHKILFDEGLVFDLPQIHSRFVTVYDPARDRVTLLDRETQVQTTVRIEDLVKVTAAARAAASTDEQREHLGLNSEVQPSKRVIGYTIRFGSLEYHTTTQKPDDPTIANDYGQFAILASRLNIVRRLGPPPFGRMTLSDHITQRGEIPLETTLTLKTRKSNEQYRSTHLLEDLSTVDRQKIAEVRGMISLYQNVDFEAFPKP